jgi:integrase
MKHRTGYLFKRGTNFYCAWRVSGKPITRALRDDSGQPITKRREAEIARSKLMAPISTADEVAVLESIAGKLKGHKAELAKWEDEQHPPSSIMQAWSDYLASPNRPDSGDSTLRQYEFQWQAFADWMKEKHADSLMLRDVSKEIAEEYASSLTRGKFRPSTYNKHLNLLALIFRVLKHKAKLTDNPWESPKRGGSLQRRLVNAYSRRELTIDELRKVCQAATGELKLMLALGIYTGLRLGDCATLRWAEVDLVRALIRRIPNKTARRNPKPVIVPIHPGLLEMLSETPVGQRTGYVMPEVATIYLRRDDMVTDMVQNHFKLCGIALYKPGTGMNGERAVVEAGFHSLRHTFVSMCREKNVPLAVVESIVGHSNPSMTRHYTHVGELAATNAVALLPNISSDAEPSVLAKRTPVEIIRDARSTAAKLTEKNVKIIKKRLLEILVAN